MVPLLAAEPAPSPASLELVRLIRWDEYLAESNAYSARKAHAEGRLTQAQFNCVILQPKDWTDDVAKYFSRVLTAKEISSAIAFFQSPSGRFFINSFYQKRDAKRRGTTLDIKTPPEVDRDPAFQAFMDSSLPYKLMPDLQGSEELAAMTKLVNDRIGRALATCPGAKS